MFKDWNIRPTTTFCASTLLFLLMGPLVCEALAGDDFGQQFAAGYCVDCHGAGEPEADVRFDIVGELEQDEQSKIWRRAWLQIEAGEMPPEDAEQPTDEERQKVLDWIVKQFGPVNKPMDADHWSLKPPVRNGLPSGLDGSWAIDHFIERKLSANDLMRSRRAERPALIRRLTLDLTGLLPTPEETQAFVDEPDFVTAYSAAVDRLLDSPRHGERWAQHWLDVIRWAETVGFETNAERREAWHYRDWVIRALNEDMPYDQFITHQLIGDETGHDAALGFLVAGPANMPGQVGRDEEAMRQARQDELDEVIQTVSQGFFGLTVGCARCHDHKFDPIAQRDYYSMQAIFAGLRYGTRRLRGDKNDDWADQVPAAREKLTTLQRELESIRTKRGLREPVANVQAEAFPAVVADAVRMEITATNQGAASLYEFEVWSTEDAGSSANVALASEGAVPSASSFALANQTRHFDNLVDGTVDPRQAFPWVSAAGGAAWIQVDLASPTEVDRIVWHKGTSVPASYEIKVRDAGSGEWKTVADASDRLPRADDVRPAAAVQLAEQTAEQVDQLMKLIVQIRKAESNLGRLSSGPQTYAASFSGSPDKLNLLHRGDPMQPRDEAIAAVPAVLVSTAPSVNPATEIERRKMLVDHLTSPSHPLTARVMVNRIWQHHFGVGLVETASDFGRMGQLPTHPELLDWLAVEFVESGWSLKHMHRIIVSSQTYMQSSRPVEEALQVDAGARLLWRYPPRRLSAEAIRDSILQVSGKLGDRMYGRGFSFFNQRGGLADYRAKETFDGDGWRRMIYAHKVRMQSVDVFGAFDCPDAGQMTPRRNRSITPIQSLGLLNSPFINRQSEFFAQRIRESAGDDMQQAIQQAFEIALGRQPSGSEGEALVELANQHGLAQACRVIFNTSEFVSLP